MFKVRGSRATCFCGILVIIRNRSTTVRFLIYLGKSTFYTDVRIYTNVSMTAADFLIARSMPVCLSCYPQIPGSYFNSVLYWIHMFTGGCRSKCSVRSTR